MKLIFLAIFMLSINTCLSQTKIKSVNINTIDTIKVSKDESQILDSNFYLSEIKRIDYHISSINTKLNWVSENEVVDSKWLMDMERFKVELLKEKSEILQKLKQL
jgi:hypothetical protein